MVGVVDARDGAVSPKSTVELYAAIRRDSRVERLSIRELARRHGVHRRVVREALTSPWPEPRKPMPPRPSALDPFKPVVDQILREDLDAPRKQRHTVKRIHERLAAEHGAEGVSYRMVRGYVFDRKPEIWQEAGRGPSQVFIGQSHRPGQEAEVDFAELQVRLRGEPTRCYLFTFRLSFSGRAVHRVFASAGLEAFMEGHVHALSVLGGVPRGQVRYDNLKAAVVKVLEFSRARVENERWLAFRSFYGMDAFYCLPGREGAHEKGGVEGEGGWFRRNHLVPVPDVLSLRELNERVEEFERADLGRRIGQRIRTIGENFAIEAPLLAPLPADRFETGTLLTPRVDRFAQVRVRTVTYSVPVRLIGRQVRVQLHANDLEIFDGRELAAGHERCGVRGGIVLELDHYLEALIRKPGALPGATVLEQARAAGRFTPVHDAWWSAARKAHGDAAGTRALIEVLLLHRHMPHEQLVAGLAAALSVGALTADAVALEARKIADRDESGTEGPASGIGEAGPVVSLTERRLRALPDDTRPLPSVAVYDSLLTHRSAPGPVRREGDSA
ncbi:MAG TPA: IS21 family transposase [Solirubrobacteraceae bacterium]|jgi:transposase